MKKPASPPSRVLARVLAVDMREIQVARGAGATTEVTDPPQPGGRADITNGKGDHD